MRAAAPPTDFPLDQRSPALALWRCGLAGVAFAVGANWSAAWLQLPGIAGPAGMTVGAAAGWLWHRRRAAQPAMRLVWNGTQWLLHSAWRDEAGRPAIALDLGPRLLLRWQPATGRRTRWLWLRAADALPARWHLMRVALTAAPQRAGQPAMP